MADEPSTTWDKSASEILAQTSKVFQMFTTGLTVAQARLEGAAQAERLVKAAQQAEAEAKRGLVQTLKEAGELRDRATADAERILSGARRDAERVRGEVALLASDKGVLTGEVAELRAEKQRLADDVRQLAGAKAALSPTQAV